MSSENAPPEHPRPEETAGNELEQLGSINSEPLWKKYWKMLPHPVRWLVVIIVGGALVIAGLIMMVTPGPGVAAIILGLVILASEFAWAAHVLDFTKNKANLVWQDFKRRIKRKKK